MPLSLHVRISSVRCLHWPISGQSSFQQVFPAVRKIRKSLFSSTMCGWKMQKNNWAGMAFSRIFANNYRNFFIQFENRKKLFWVFFQIKIGPHISDNVSFAPLCPFYAVTKRQGDWRNAQNDTSVNSKRAYFFSGIVPSLYCDQGNRLGSADPVVQFNMLRKIQDLSLR